MAVRARDARSTTPTTSVGHAAAQTVGGPMSSDRVSRSDDFGHTRRGWAVEFNMAGICACRTLTVETKEEAETLKHLIERERDTKDVRLVRDE